MVAWKGAPAVVNREPEADASPELAGLPLMAPSACLTSVTATANGRTVSTSDVPVTDVDDESSRKLIEYLPTSLLARQNVATPDEKFNAGMKLLVASSVGAAIESVEQAPKVFPDVLLQVPVARLLVLVAHICGALAPFGCSVAGVYQPSRFFAPLKAVLVEQPLVRVTFIRCARPATIPPAVFPVSESTFVMMNVAPLN